MHDPETATSTARCQSPLEPPFGVPAFEGLMHVLIQAAIPSYAVDG